MNSEIRTPNSAIPRQECFNFLFPYGARTLITTGQAAKCLGRKEAFVRELIEDRKLESHADTAFGQRLSNRITSRSVLLHLARTAQYDPDDIADAVIDVIATISNPQQLARIARACGHPLK